MQLFNFSTNTLEDTPESQVQSALLSGNFGVRKGERLSVFHPDEGYFSIAPEDFTGAIEKGYQYEPAEAVQARKEKAKYDTVGQEAITGIEGALSGLTFGGSRLIEKGLLGNAEEQEARQRVNPIVSGASEIGGALLPLAVTALSPVPGDEALAAANTGRAVNLLRGAAEVAPTSLLAKGGLAVERGVEGLLPKATGAISRSILKNAPKIAGSAVEGAFYGGANSVSEDLLGDSEINAEKLLSSIGFGMVAGGALGGGIGVAGDLVGSAASRKLAGWGVGKTVLRALGNTEKEVAFLGKSAADDLAHFAQKNGAVQLLEGADDAASRVASEQAGAFKKVAALADDAAVTAQYSNQTGLPSSVIKERATHLEQLALAGNKKTGDKRLAELDAKLTDFASTLNPDKKVAFREALDSYDNWSSLRRIAETQPAPQSILPDTNALLGAGFALSHGNILAAAGALAAPLAKRVIQAVEPKVTAVALMKLEKAIGSISSRMEKGVNGMMRPVERGFIRKAVAPVASLSFTGEKVKKGETRQKSFTRQSGELAGLADPAEMERVVSREFAGLASVAPKLAEQARAKRSAQLAFIISKSPINPRAGQPVIPGITREWQPADSQLATFDRYLKAVNDPMSILDDMEQGKLTSEQVETMQTLFPRMFEEVRASVMQKLASNRDPLPYGKRVALSLLFGISGDPTLLPEFIQAQQALYQAQPDSPENQQQVAPGSNTGALTLAAASQTEAQRITSG